MGQRERRVRKLWRRVLKRSPRSSILLGGALALALTGACSLHSLDYLDAGSARGGGSGSASGGGGSGSTGAVGGTSVVGGTSAVAGAGQLGGSTSSQGGASSGSGGMSTAGAAGAEPDPANCTDGRATGDETDKDCGGRHCQPCDTGGKCVTGTDCQSAICTNQVCQAPTCTDLALNGKETDLNCGGGCPGCPQGGHCTVDADCVTSTCEAGLCESATCADGVLKVGCPLLVDNTPYSLSPGHALSKCIDDDKRSVADGTGMILYTCNTEINQTFWAVERASGYFALRGALSGKCLQLRGGSLDAGTAIEQSTCDYSEKQLWKPSIVDSSLMQLTSKLSGLALDVAGDNVEKNTQPIVESEADGSADTHWRVVKRTSAAYLALSPNGDNGLRIRHDAALTTLTDDDDATAHWKVVPGLYDPSMVSFQSRSDPGRYLRHALFRLWTDSNDGSDQFKQDATFRYASPLAGSSSLSKSFESINYPGRYWLRDGDTIILAPLEDTSVYKYNATWWFAGR